jgi:hypothetical protein
VYLYLIIQAQRSMVGDVQVIDGGIDTAVANVSIANARIVASKRFSSVFQISDVGTVPHTGHHIYLTEPNGAYADVFQLFH